ncbi:MAG: hypothetical protein ABIP75_07695 [Pyrinomonadaceae bacterium]
MNRRKRHVRWVLTKLLLLLVFVLAGGGVVRAQDDDFRLPGPVPPPLRFVAVETRSQLAAEPDPKRHAKMSLELAEASLARAESLTGQQDFTAAAIELAQYQGLIHQSITYLQAIPPKDNKTLDMFKRLEIALRTHCPRLESLRRNTPLSYATNIKEVIVFAEASRDTSLNCFFGDTVVREKAPAKTATTPTDDNLNKTP